MKKVLVIVLIVAMLSAGVVGCSCGGGGKGDSYEVAMITDAGDIDDKSFNQGTWEGIVDYAKENDKTYKYYKPTEVSTNAYVAAIDLAVQGGAKVIVTPGFLFESAVYVAQDKYPDVHFILLDGTPHDEAYENFKTGDNTYAFTFAEQQVGFLAGYAAVKEGYTKIGYMGRHGCSCGCPLWLWVRSGC